MKVVIAMDSFKGSLPSLPAGHAAAEGIRRVYPDVEIFVLPLADGGEGTVDAILSCKGAEAKSVSVCGPLGEPVEAVYALWNGTAYMEMSAAAGITLISPEERNPLHTTTYGVGEMIRHGIMQGCRDFVIGIGGSATNDGGVGMLQALGFAFLDDAGEPVPLGAKGLEKIASVGRDKAMPELQECRFHIACDVTNPLCGKLGCSAVYGPQKGATEDMIARMDAALSRFASLSDVDPNTPGSGAAGGLGFAFLAYLNGELKPGVDLILKKTQLESYVKDADIVITGEGRLDGQTAMGKAPVGVAKLAKKHGKKVIAFSGCVTKDAKKCNEAGIDAFFPIVRTVCTLEEAMDTENAFSNMADTAEQVFRLLHA